MKSLSPMWMACLAMLFGVLAIVPASAQKIEEFKKATKDDQIETIRKYLAGGGNPNAVEGPRELTLLHWAAFNGSIEVVKVLVEKGANVNARAKNPDWMPLHYASGMGHSKVVTYLLDRGAQLDAPTSDGYTALSGAASNAKTDNVRLLLARSADGGHALAYLMRRNNLDAIRLLLTSGVSADATPRTEYRHLGISPGETALFKAVSAQNLDLAVLLLGAGANPNIASPKSPNMPTPLMMAAYHCDGPMIDALMARGASRNTTSHSGDTAASLARKGWTTNMQPCPANILAKLQ